MNSTTITEEEILYKAVTNNIKNYQSLVLAYSGGLDSTVLLDILYNILNKKINFNKINISQLFTLRAIHVHHGLNPDADYWSYHCAKECKKRHIPFNLIQIYCKKHKFNGIENTAREMRYQHLFNNLKKQEILLTAHHLHDQAETFLLALKRGSGPTGLSAMPKKKFIYHHQLLRPLLQCSKDKIEKYAKNKELTWIIDNSNKNTSFDRNFFRLQILPKLRDRWPKIDQTIARSAQLCSDQERLLDELLKKELKTLNYHDHSLLTKPLINMSVEKRQALIRRWLMSLNIQMPSHKRLSHIWNNVILSKKDTTPNIQLNKSFLLRRFQNRLYIVPNTIQTPLYNTTIYWRNIQKKIFLPYQLGILISKTSSNTKNNSLNKMKTYSGIKISLQNTFSHILPHHRLNNLNKILSLSSVRAPHEKEIITIKFNCIFHSKISILGTSYNKKFKNIWKELKIPSWIKKNIPLLFYDDKFIAALGVLVTKDGKVKETDTELKIYWIQKHL